MKPPEFDLDQASEFLGVPAWTVERWVRQGLLSASTSSPRPSFDRSQLERWARRHGMTVPGKRMRVVRPPADMLADALERGSFSIATSLETASGAIDLAVRSLPDLEQGVKDVLVREVQARERLASTAFGRGIALPHPRRPPSELIQKPLASLVRSERPLDWAAFDAQPVDLVLLVASPTAVEHLEILSRISFALRVPEFVSTLREATSAEQITTRLRELRMSS